MGKHLVGILILSLALLLPGRYTPCIESKPLHLAMILSCGETEAEQGFKDRLQELGYTVYYTVLNAEQNHKKLGVLLHELIPKLESFDYIYTFGTTVSSTPRVSVNNRVPQCFMSSATPWTPALCRACAWALLDRRSTGYSAWMTTVPAYVL